LWGYFEEVGKKERDTETATSGPPFKGKPRGAKKTE